MSEPKPDKPQTQWVQFGRGRYYLREVAREIKEETKKKAKDQREPMNERPMTTNAI